MRKKNNPEVHFENNNKEESVAKENKFFFDYIVMPGIHTFWDKGAVSTARCFRCVFIQR